MTAAAHRMHSRGAAAVLLLAFTLSGAAGLVLQLLWTLTASTFYGVSAHAIATILAAFMGGLALGAWLGTRILARSALHPLVLYALSEVVIALSAVGIQWGFDHSQGLAAWFATQLPGHSPLSLLGRWLLLMGLFLVPTAAMGASFPFFCRGLVGGRGRGFLGWLSAAYGVNVLGAAVGCYLTATVLLMELGIWKSVLLAGGLNLLAAGLAWGIHRGSPRVTPPKAPPTEPNPVLFPAPVLYALIAASGFSAMAFEVIWSRMVRQALWLANPFQAFAQVLSLILLGMAMGSILLALRRLDRARALRVFGRIQLVIAGICILGITQLRWDLATLLAGDLIRLYQWVSIGTLGAGALMLGMGFPLLAATHSQAAEKIGGLYAASALGGVLGTLAGGFVLIPLLGTRGGLLVLAVGFAITGGLALLAPRWSASTRKPLWLARLLAAPVVLALGVGARTEDRLDFECQGCTLLWLNDGLEATTAVARPPDGNATLYTNGKSITPGALPQRALTPFLFAPVVDRVLSIGFGSGQLALMVAENFPETQLDCVELDGNMAQTTEFFGTTELFSLSNFELFIDDGRQHMLRSPQTYDVILADTFTHSINTQIYGSGFFEVARDALTEQGSFFITVPLQDLPSNTEAEIILRTAAESFPHTYVLAPNGMVGIIGRKQPLQVESALQALPQTLQGELSFELSPTDIYEIDAEVLAQFSSERVNSDDQPYFFPLMQMAGPGTAEQMHAQVRAWGQLSAGSRETRSRTGRGPPRSSPSPVDSRPAGPAPVGSAPR